MRWGLGLCGQLDQRGHDRFCDRVILQFYLHLQSVAALWQVDLCFVTCT